MGDPAGVGPEIIVKACRKLQPRLEAGELQLLVIGHRSALRAACDVLHETLAFPESDSAALALLPAGEEHEPIRFGVLSPEAGRFAYRVKAGSRKSHLLVYFEKRAIIHSENS